MSFVKVKELYMTDLLEMSLEERYMFFLAEGYRLERSSTVLDSNASLVE